MKKLLLILLLHLTGLAYAQNTITGRVTTAKEGIPLPGVSVVAKGSSVGTTTDAEGAYSLNAPASATTLSFSFIGFVTQEVPIGNKATINVQLAEDAQALEEVVVVGYGTQLRREVTTAISSVKPEEITQTPVQRVEQALQGRVAGVQVANISGQPGDAPTVRIRGIGTNGNASPLYIVDGFPVGGIDYLNPADIESMEVLKDAASTAIYGARGANGVVLITTRSGSRDGKMHISYDGYIGFQNPWKQMDLLNAREYATLMNEGAANAGSSIPYPDVNQFGEGTDWQEALFEKDAPIMNHQISVNGGSEKNAYAASFSIFDQNGIVGGDKSNFKRYTARVNTDNQVKDFLKVGTNLAYSHIDRRAIDPNQEFGGLLSNAINLDPLTPVIVTDPALLAKSPYNNPNVVRDANGNPYGISQYVAQEIVNPLARLAVLNGRTRVDKLVGNIYGEVEILEGLTFRSTFGLDLAFVTANNFNPVFYLNRSTANTNSLVSKGVDRYYNWQTENYFTYNKTFGDHDLGLTAGTSALKFNFESLYASNTGLVSNDPNYAYLNTAVDRGSAIATGGFNERALFSLFGRVNYGYKGKYLFAATIRRDGSSRFGENNPYATFPSVSAGWVISDEDFFPESNFISFAKLRASWGQNGNEEIGGAYPWASTIGVGRGYSFYSPSGVGYLSGAAPEYIANPNLKWEASEQTDIGLDMALFNNNLQITADYYIKRTKGLLLYAPIPATAGNNLPLVNGGEVENKGFELALNYSNEINDFSYGIGLNGSLNKNKFVSIDNAEGVLQGASISTYGAVSRSEVGQPIAYFWGYKTDGIFQNSAEVAAHKTGQEVLQPAALPGDVRFVDTNNDGVINDQDRTKIGNPTPKAVIGFTLDLGYKNFDINAFVNGAFGHQIFNGTRRHDLSTSNMQSKYLNRWTGKAAPTSTRALPGTIRMRTTSASLIFTSKTVITYG
ncbi:TonB-dependent receptor [Pontibacter rugosus]